MRKTADQLVMLAEVGMNAAAEIGAVIGEGGETDAVEARLTRQQTNLLLAAQTAALLAIAKTLAKPTVEYPEAK